MNGTSKKRLFGMAAALALVAGLYAVGNDGYAHGPVGYQAGRTGQGMMGPGTMITHHGTMGHQGMGPGMMGSPSGPFGHQGMGPGMMGGPMNFTKLTTDTTAIESYLTNLKARLNIATTQEEAWKAYAEAIRTQVTTHTDVHNTVHGTVVESPQDRASQHLAAMEKIIAQRKFVFQKYRSLYDQLDEKQRLTANQLSWPCHS